jgi:hypothetical protein
MKPNYAVMLWVVVLAVVLLAGCAGPLAKAVNDDLINASAMAQAGGDKEGAACWDCLQKANTATGFVGVAGAIEQARLVRACRAQCSTVLIP